VAICRRGDSAEVSSLSASSAPASAERCAIISSRVSDERLCLLSSFVKRAHRHGRLRASLSGWPLRFCHRHVGFD
jgi:hypothetical protein